MKKHLSLFAFTGLLTAIFCFCKKSESPLSSVENVPVVVNPYDLPTPDSLAFNGTVACGVSQGWWKYCGYASCLADSVLWRPAVSFSAFANKGSDSTGTVIMYEFDKAGYPIKRLEIAQFRLRTGIYLPIKELLPSDAYDLIIDYRDLDDACSHHTIYKTDTTKQSFIKVLSYDPATQRIKIRFNLYFQIYEAKKPGYPAFLHFDDGVFFGKAIKR